jgi:hypothetical protein
MRQPGVTIAAIVILVGLSCYQILCIEDLRSRMERLEKKASSPKSAVRTGIPTAGTPGPSITTNHRRPQQESLHAAASLPPWLVERKWEEMIAGVEAWNGDGKLNSRFIEVGGVTQSQALELEAIRKSLRKAREEVPILPPEVIENAPGKVVVQLGREDSGVIDRLREEQERSLDSVLGTHFDPVLRKRILPPMNSAELTEVTLERVDNENFRIRRIRREIDGGVTFSSIVTGTTEESRLPEILSDAEKAALRLAGHEY